MAQKDANMEFIEQHPDIMFGKALVKGTRITAEQILEDLSWGASMEDLLNAYPNLTREGILSALAFAVDALKGQRSYRIAQ